MNGKHCYLCNEPKSVVGHDTQTCPNVICIKCEQKGHIYQNCLQLNIDQQKPEKSEVVQKEPKTCETCDVFSKCKSCRVSLASKNSLKKHIDLKSGFDHIKRKSEVKEETLIVKSSKVDQKMHNDKEILDFPHDIEFSNDIKPKFEIKEKPFDVKTTNHGGLLLNIDQKSEKSEVVQKEPKTCNTCDVFSKCKNCRVSLASKKSLKKDIDLKSGFDHIKRKSEVKEETLTAKSSKIEHKSDPKMQNDKEMLDALYDIEFSNDIKAKFEIKEKPFDVKTSNHGTSHDCMFSQSGANDIKPKLEIKEKAINVKTTNYGASHENYLFSQLGANVLPKAPMTDISTPSLVRQPPPGQTRDIKRKYENKEETLIVKSSKIDQKSDIVDPQMHNDKEMLDALHDIEFSNDIKAKFEIKEKPIDVKTTNYGASHPCGESGTQEWIFARQALQKIANEHTNFSSSTLARKILLCLINWGTQWTMDISSNE